MAERILNKLTNKEGSDGPGILNRITQSQASESENFLKKISAAQLPDCDQTEITNALLYIQTNINQSYFSKLSIQEVERVFTEIWKFLLFAANHNASNIRLTSYRSTGLFLLKITPYFTRSIWRTFSDIAMQSTIDIKSSAILASSFAFIANQIPLHTLEKFCDTTPIFHHFTISDPIFSEHLASIISKLKRMGLEWMQTLLHSFLKIISVKNDRFLFKSLSAIVTHFPDVLMKEVIEFVLNEPEPTKFIPLISFILSSVININTENIDLSGIALLCIEILKNQQNHIQAEIDSSFLILGCSSKYFTVNFEVKDFTKIEITVNTNQKSKNVTLDIQKFHNIPAFYNMRLPLQILRPSLDDGSLIVQTKIKTLGYVAKENQEEYVKILLDSLNENNDDRQASCCASLALCINNLEPNLQLSQLFAQLVLTKQQSWFKSLNVMNLLAETSANTVESLVGVNGIKKVIGILYDLTFNQNDKVYRQSPVVLSKFIRPKDYSYVLMKIASNIDYFDLESFRRSINLLTIIVRDHQQDMDLKFLHFLIVSIVEGLEFFKEDLNLISNIFLFLSYFDLSFLSSSQSSSLATFALDIAAAELHIINGQKPDFGNNSSVSEIIGVLESDLQSKNFDIISGQDTDHESYLSSLYSVIKLFNSLPNDCCYLPSQLNLANALIKIFPHESARLYEKLWKSMTENEQSTILSTISPCLATMKDFGAIAIWAYLLLTKLPDAASRFVQARDVIHKLSYYALQHLEVVPDGVLFVFVRYEATVVAEISTIQPLIWQIPENRRNRMLNKLMNDHPEAYKRLMGDQQPPPIVEDVKPLSDTPILNVEYNVNMSNDYTWDLTSPHIITQLRNNCFEFNKDILQKLALTYCRFTNNVGLRALLNYATRTKVNLDFNPLYVPHSLLPMVIQYIRIIKDPFGPTFVSQCLKLSHSKEVSITSASIIPQTFISTVTQDRITKKGITKVLYAISKVALPKETVFEFVLKCLDKNAPPKRYLTVLTLATVACSLIPRIEAKWIDGIISKLKENENDINLSVLSRFVHSAVTKVPNCSLLNEYLKTKIIENVGKNTLESCIASLSLLSIENNYKTLEKIYENSQNYLTGITPSLFSTGVKFLNSILTKSKDSSLDGLMKNNKLNQVMQRVTEFDKIPFIHENIVLFYSNIMTRQTLSSYQKVLIKSFDQIIPIPSSPSFPAMSVLIPKLIAGGDQEIQKKCLLFSEKLMTKPASLFLMRCQIQIIREIATKMSTYETFILDRATEFLSKAHKIDGPYMSDILYEYISFITESLGFSDGVQFVVLQFHKYIPRFISLFVALAKLYSRVDDEKKKHICSILPNVLLVNAHKVAIECIGNKHKMSEALKLACYEEDCAESNEIIGRIRKM